MTSVAQISQYVETADRLGASLCGAVLRHPEWLPELREIVTFDQMGFKPRSVWLTILNLADKGKPFDAVSVGDALDGDYVTPNDYADKSPVTLFDAKWHAERLRERWKQLELARIGQQLAASALDTPSSHLIEKLGEEAARLSLVSPPQALRMISIGAALEELVALSKAPVYPTPYETLNSHIGFGGFLGTQVYTLAAGTGRGKTSWVADVAAHAAETVPVLVASFEMKPGYFVARKAAGVLGVHSNSILRCEIPAHLVLKAMPYPRLWLMHKPSLAELRIAVDRLSQKYGSAPLVVVDYLQKLADLIAKNMVRADLRLATSEASEALGDIADRSGAAIVSVSAIGRQNNRRAAQPRKLEPYELVDVSKESGAVEYDGAGMIVLSLSNDFDGEERIATMTLAKARFGQECHIDARYNGARGAWRDLGRVERVEGVTTPPAPEQQESREEVVRKLIAGELNKRPARTKTDLLSRLRGCRKDTAREVYEAMLADGAIVKIGTGLTLSDVGRQLVIGGVE